MNERRSSVVLLIMIGTLTCLAKPVATQNSVPPDQQAFKAARLLEDPHQQLTALLKLIADFPETRSAGRARSAAFELLVAKFPDRVEDIKQQMKAILQAAPPEDHGPYLSVAETLGEAGVLLDHARTHAEEAVSRVTRERYISRLTKQRAEAKLPLGPPEELENSYKTIRATALGILGIIVLKQGDPDRARRIFEDAERHDQLTYAAEGLGLLAFKEGREDAAYEYLLRARVRGAPSRESRALLETLFAKRHGGSIAELDDALDEAYRKYHVNPIVRRPYVRKDPAMGRTSLLEMFTGANCPPCAGANLAVHAIRDRFDPADLVVLMYHSHVPGPDPLTNPDGVVRASYYSATSAPTFLIDGEKETGGASRNEAQRPYNRLNELIEKALTAPPRAKLSLSASRSGRVVTAQARLDDVDWPAGELKIRFALVEREVRYSGSNGIRHHMMVVRAVSESRVERSSTAPAVVEFDVTKVSAALMAYLDEYERRNDKFGPLTFLAKPSDINPANLAVVAFLQNDDDKRILQSAVVDVGQRPERAP